MNVDCFVTTIAIFLPCHLGNEQTIHNKSFMKNTFKALLLLSTLGIALLSCNEPDVKTASNQAEIEKTELFDFKGEKVLIPATFPKELFNQSTQDFETYYNKLSGSDNTRSSGDKKVISLNELHEVLRTSLKNIRK